MSSHTSYHEDLLLSEEEKGRVNYKMCQTHSKYEIVLFNFHIYKYTYDLFSLSFSANSEILTAKPLWNLVVSCVDWEDLSLIHWF